MPVNERFLDTYTAWWAADLTPIRGELRAIFYAGLRKPLEKSPARIGTAPENSW